VGNIQNCACNIIDPLNLAKNFNRTLASFALVPSTQAHPLTSNVMVVNTSGDLELYAVHDTPKQAPWSPRGDLAIGAGQSYKIIPGFHESEPPAEPWDIPTASNNFRPESVARSDQTGEESIVRGRVKHTAASALLGRADEDVFPVLGLNAGKGPTNLAATRPGKSRTYSPASFRNYHLEHSPDRSTLRGKNSSRTTTVDQLAQSNERSSRARSRRSQPPKSSTRGKRQSSIIHQVVEDDVSMTMRIRAVSGYGLSNVRVSVFTGKQRLMRSI